MKSQIKRLHSYEVDLDRVKKSDILWLVNQLRLAYGALDVKDEIIETLIRNCHEDYGRGD